MARVDNLPLKFSFINLYRIKRLTLSVSVEVIFMKGIEEWTF